jgi:hypothetical protein
MNIFHHFSSKQQTSSKLLNPYLGIVPKNTWILGAQQVPDLGRSIAARFVASA